MDFSAKGHLAAVRRQVARTGGDDPVAIGMTRVLGVPVADLWAALTVPDRLAKWFSPVSGDLILGGRFAITGNASGAIQHCTPLRAIRLSWDYGGQSSQVDLRLTKLPKGAGIDLTHTANPDDAMATYGPGALGLGWEWSLMELARHLGGAAQRFDEDALAATPEGKDFVRGSAQSWAQADIDAGADPAQAKAAAQRTAAFFLGE